MTIKHGQPIDPADHFVAERGIEVDPVRLEQLARGRVVALGLDALHLGQQPPHALAMSNMRRPATIAPKPPHSSRSSSALARET